MGYRKRERDEINKKTDPKNKHGKKKRPYGTLLKATCSYLWFCQHALKWRYNVPDTHLQVLLKNRARINNMSGNVI